ncbi:alpha/beta hydrolase [Deinococcus aerophilus]|nr:alpha/beta hydrolase-fold protein [Deinococcus aerophilus]
MARLRVLLPTLPPHTPAGDLFLTGQHRAWSSDPAGWTFRRCGAGAELNVEFPEGTLLGLKVRVRTAHGQVIEEGNAWGGRAPAHTGAVTGDMTLTLDLAGWQDRRQGRDQPPRSAAPREELTLAAPWGEQTVRLWWPAAHPTAALPRVILHDGQNVFDEAASFAGQSWDAAGAAQVLAGEGHPCLIVALSVNEERSRRYVPFPFELNGFQPGADEYLDWIMGTLQPALSARFGNVDAAHTALAGSSFGGLVTLYGGLRDPQGYGTLGVFSPAVWPADFELLRWLQGRTAPDTRVWVDMGDHEADTVTGAAEVVRRTQDLAARLRPAVRNLQFTVGAGHWHDEAAWAARLPGFLRWWLTGLDR